MSCKRLSEVSHRGLASAEVLEAVIGDPPGTSRSSAASWSITALTHMPRASRRESCLTALHPRRHHWHLKPPPRGIPANLQYAQLRHDPEVRFGSIDVAPDGLCKLL